MNNSDYDTKVSELVNGVPTANNQDGETLEDYMENGESMEEFIERMRVERNLD